MGFGHRVYRTEDPRVRHFRATAQAMSRSHGDMRGFETVEALVAAMQPFARLGIGPNVDLYAGLVYRLMGLPGRSGDGDLRRRPHARLDRPGTGAEVEQHPDPPVAAVCRRAKQALRAARRAPDAAVIASSQRNPDRYVAMASTAHRSRLPSAGLWFLAGTFASNIGNGMHTLAAGALLYQETGTVAAFGVVVAVEQAATFLMQLLAGPNGRCRQSAAHGARRRNRARRRRLRHCPRAGGQSSQMRWPLILAMTVVIRVVHTSIVPARSP